MMKYFLNMLVLLCVISCGDSTDSGGEVIEEFQLKGSVSGLVLDTLGKALEGVSVTLDPSGETSVTDLTGLYTIPDVPSGTYDVVFSKENYKSQTVSGVVLLEDQELTLETVTLVFALDTLVNQEIQNKIDSLKGTLKDREITGSVAYETSVDSVLLKMYSSDSTLLYEEKVALLSGKISQVVKASEEGGFVDLLVINETGAIEAFSKTEYEAGTGQIDLVEIASKNSVPQMSLIKNLYFVEKGNSLEISLNLGDSNNYNQDSQWNFTLNENAVVVENSKLLLAVEWEGTQSLEIQMKDSDGNVVSESIQVKGLLEPELKSFSTGSYYRKTAAFDSIEVQISKEFKMAPFEVTVGEFVDFLNDLSLDSVGTSDLGVSRLKLFNFPQGIVSHQIEKNGIQFSTENPHWPIYHLSWFGAVLYTEWLNEKFSLETVVKTVSEADTLSVLEFFRSHRVAWETTLVDTSKNGFRLPTENEWEWAALEPGFEYAGADLENLPDFAVYNSSTPMDVGSKKPNSKGMYDMSGNVSEWLLDKKGKGGFDSEEFFVVNRLFKGGNFATDESSLDYLETQNFNLSNDNGAEYSVDEATGLRVLRAP